MNKRKKLILTTAIIFAAFISTAITLPLVLKDAPTKHNYRNNDKMLVGAIKSDSLPLPRDVKKILPSQANRPAPGVTPKQVAYTFRRWIQDDAAGTIRWTVQLKKGVVQRELSGQIKGFLTTFKKTLQNNKNVPFAAFNQVLRGLPQPLPDGQVLETTLEALDGHALIPAATGGIERTFNIKNDRATGIAKVVVKFRLGTISDTTTYTISGFRIIPTTPIESETNLRPVRQKAQMKIAKVFQKVKRHIDHSLAQKEWNQIIRLRDRFLSTLATLKTTAAITSLQQRVANDLTQQGDVYKREVEEDFRAKMRDKTNNYHNEVLPVGFIIPAGITTIPSYAFYNTSFPERFRFPSAVQTIATNAFNGAIFKNDPKLPDRVELGAQAFRKASIPVGFHVPNGVRTTGETKLNDVFINLRIKPWRRWVNETGAHLETMIPKRGSTLTKPLLNHITFVAKEEFMHQVLPNGFTIPDTVTRILEAAFMGATIPTNLILPNGLQTIGSHAFKGARLPSGFTLTNCAQLREIESSGFQDTRLPKSFNLPLSLQIIGLYAFRGSTINTGFQLPNNVNLNDGGAFEDALLPNGFRIPAGRGFTRDTFKNAKLPLWSLFKKSKKSKNTWFSARKLWEHWSNFQNKSLRDIKGAVVTRRPLRLSFISAFEFTNRDDLPDDFEIPAGIIEIREAAFKGAKLPAGFKIPLSVTKIQKSAFARTKIGTEFKLAPNVILADEVFRGTRLPDGFKIPETAKLTHKTFYKAKLPLWSRWHKKENEKVLEKWFGTARLNKQLEIKAKGEGIKWFSIKGAIVQRQIRPTFIDIYEFEKRKLGVDFTIPETVTTIYKGAFKEVKLPEDFKLPVSVETIGQLAFTLATLPDDFRVPNTVKTIYNNAFLGARHHNKKPLRVPARGTS